MAMLATRMSGSVGGGHEGAMTPTAGAMWQSTQSAANLEQLRQRIWQLCAPQQQIAQKRQYLSHVLAKWSAGRPQVSYTQFFQALQSLSMPLHGATEIFSLLDRGGSGVVSISDFCDCMFADAKAPTASAELGSKMVRPPALPSLSAGSRSGQPSPENFTGPSGTGKLGSSMRSAGSAMVASGTRGPCNQPAGSSRPPSGRQSATGSRTPGYGGGGGDATLLLTPSSGLAATQQGQPRKAPGVRVSSAASVRSARSASARSTSASARGTQSGGGGLARLSLCDLVVNHVREALLQRCGPAGIQALACAFRSTDSDSSRLANVRDVNAGLADVGLQLEPKDLQLLLAALDKDNRAALSLNDFIAALRGASSERREAMINGAFDALDPAGSGRVHADDIAAIYDVRQHPEVLLGMLAEEHAVNHFLSQFESVRKDGFLTRFDFAEYYRNLSPSIDSEEQFELMLRNTWRLHAGGAPPEQLQHQRQHAQPPSGSMEAVPVLVSLDDGRQEVVPMPADGSVDFRDPQAVLRQLEAQGVYGAVGYTLGE
eukprot:TRINITY_DN41685_c0_g2_i1.p1 TRINITY_DN41685_c0_g2~~TRINITY_DN41685_c0_g2_i1.p1  ORF type:complete len:544 (+),score=134.04 TRINITY_DN41685_c0_g2_i1:76-1707(+)